jgi:hypothetical protein
MLPRFKPRMCARGSITAASDTDLYAVAMLYNNSTGRDLLVVRDVQPNSGGAPGTATPFDLLIGYKQGNSGTIGGIITPLVPGDTTPPGQLYTDIVAFDAFNSDYALGGQLESVGAWVHDFPFAILQPGWSLQILVAVPDTAFQAAFFWQYCTPPEIDGTQEDFLLETLRERLA